MLSQDLTSCAAGVGTLAGTVTEEQWRFLRLLRANLLACADGQRGNPRLRRTIWARERYPTAIGKTRAAA